MGPVQVAPSVDLQSSGPPLLSSVSDVTTPKTRPSPITAWISPTSPPPARDGVGMSVIAPPRMRRTCDGPIAANPPHGPRTSHRELPTASRNASGTLTLCGSPSTKYTSRSPNRASCFLSGWKTRFPGWISERSLNVLFVPSIAEPARSLTVASVCCEVGSARPVRSTSVGRNAVAAPFSLAARDVHPAATRSSHGRSCDANDSRSA